MRARRGTLVGVAVFAAALLAPGVAGASGTTAWRDAQADVPSTVTFEAVARTSDDSIVAVGRDGAGADAVPVIYRLAGGTWHRDTVGDAPVHGTLLDVAANASGVWAVGRQGALGDQGADPLIVKLTPPAPAAPADADPPADPADPSADPPPADPGARAWTVETPPAEASPLLSLSLADAGGYAGDGTGRLWPVAGPPGDTRTAIQVARTAPKGDPRQAAVNGFALTGAGSGIAVTDGSMTDDRIYAVSGSTSTSQPTVPDTAGRSVVAVDARSATDALAVDPDGYWKPGAGGAWQRTAVAGSAAGARLTDVDLGEFGATAVGGAIGADGYVWRGTPNTSAPEKVATGAAVNGVAIAGPDDVWAVGDRGSVHHYSFVADPTPVCTQNCGDSSGGSGSGNGSSGSGSGSGSGAGSGSSGSGSGASQGSSTAASSSGNGTTTTTVPPAEPGDPTIYIVEPDHRPAPRRGHPRPRHRRLLDRVAVKRTARALVISFRLLGPARVSIAAKRGGAVVASATSRALRAGRRRVTLRFAGAPPTELRIVVRPLSVRRTRSATRGGNTRA
jgi:uncharacterized membrane protein YgcG